jgi:hypothetical protein
MDGARSLLKHEIRKEQLKPVGHKLQNTNEIVVFLRDECNKYYANMFMLEHTSTFSMKLKWEMLINLDYLDVVQ